LKIKTGIRIGKRESEMPVVVESEFQLQNTTMTVERIVCASRRDDERAPSLSRPFLHHRKGETTVFIFKQPLHYSTASV